jgi:phosphohistidine swiveling domain-containing protein
VLVRKETNPEDLEGMIAANGILTSRGGKTSHAAVVARGMGKTAVCGAESLEVDADAKQARAGDLAVSEGDVLSIDGSTGEVFVGELPVVPSPVVQYLEEGIDAALADADSDVTEVSVRSTVCSPTRTASGGCGSGPTSTRRPTPTARAGWARRASGCAAPSTCSSATAAS